MIRVTNRRTGKVAVLTEARVRARLEEKAANGEFSPWGEQTIEAFWCAMDGEGGCTVLCDCLFETVEES